MAPARITGALLARIGEPAAVELTELLREQQHEAAEAMMTHCTERFERRLSEEISLVRVAISDGFAAIRREMSTDRIEILNKMSKDRVELRNEMSRDRVELLNEMSKDRVEMLSEM